MAKYAADFAYLDEGQCNDRARDSAVSTKLAPDATAIATRRRSSSFAMARWARRGIDLVIALATFSAQVAVVVAVIVLIAKFSIH